MRPARWHGPLALAIGILVIATTVYAGREGRRQLDRDLREIATLQAQLDSVRLRWRGAVTTEDSARFSAEVARREDLLGRRAYHIPFHTISVEQFWRPRGNGVIGVAGGALLLLLGVWATIAARRRSP